jgi:hypothetical protein
LNGVNQYISTDTQKKIADAGIEDTDVNAFIQHHLLEKRFENGDEMLRDIFITTEMQDQIDSFALKNLGVLIK